MHVSMVDAKKGRLRAIKRPSQHWGKLLKSDYLVDFSAAVGFLHGRVGTKLLVWISPVPLSQAFSPRHSWCLFHKCGDSFRSVRCPRTPPVKPLPRWGDSGSFFTESSNEVLLGDKSWVGNLQGHMMGISENFLA